jgi:hypothetical protein
MKLSRLVFAMLVVTAGIPASGAADGGEPPLVDAGLDQSVVAGTTVYLDGGGSVDPDGEIVAYRWSIETPRGETITPTDRDAEMTRFVPEQTGRYHVQLTVTDDDGNTRSDTLYVDVGGSVDARTGNEETTTPETGDRDSPETGSSDSSVDSSPQDIVDGSTAPVSQRSQNEAPFGQIFGPDSVRAGSSARYVLEAGDSDGEVMDYRWQQASHSTGGSRVINPHSAAQSYSFDVEPGTEVELSALVIDDDHNRTVVRKTVAVTNNPPQAMVHGNSTVEVGSVHQYEVVASDPDGPVDSVDWVTDSAAVEEVETGGILDGGMGSVGERSRLYRFTSIPKDDATVSVRAKATDKHAGTTTAEKGVTVVEEYSQHTTPGIENSKQPQLLAYKASQNNITDDLFSVQDAVPGRIVFTAVATDNDSERLTFEWEFGDLGTAETVASGEQKRSEVSFAFGADEVDYYSDVPITLTITDQNGNSKSETRYLSFTSNGGEQRMDDSLNVSKTGNLSVRGSFIIQAPADQDEPPSHVKIFLGDGTVQTIEDTQQDESNSYEYHFSHQYESAGKYNIQVKQDTTTSRETVSVGSRTYVVWEYERGVMSEKKTVAAERPAGDGWERTGVDHVRREQVTTLTRETRISDGQAMNPGQGWERVGTIREYTTEERTKRSTESPGEEWDLSERNVDTATVRTGTETKIVPDKIFADDDWDYLGKIEETTENTEIRQSVGEPDGHGWEKGSKTGDSVQTGTTTKWVGSTSVAEADWTYVKQERRAVSHYKKEVCVEYIEFIGGKYCNKKETRWTTTYGTFYKYIVPEYSAEYSWERTVEETTYSYKYRDDTYATKNVHEYTKEEQISTKYAEWEKPEYNRTEVYQWNKTETSWEESTSLSQPIGDVRNVEKKVRECGDEWESGEPETCRGNEP